MGMKSIHFANAMLLIITLAWGLTFPLIKSTASMLDPCLFVALRFSIAAIALLPFINRNALKSSKIIIAGLTLGLLNSSVYVLQTYSLSLMSASRCAFLAGSVVLWVPIFAKMLLKIKIRRTQIFASLLCLTGLWILTGANIASLGYGDFIMLIAEAFFALALIYLDRVSAKNIDLMTLAFYQVVFTCPLPFLLSILMKPSLQPLYQVSTMFTVLFCALFATALALSLQINYQRYTSSFHTALIFSLEPLWASLFANYMYGEALTQSLIVGGGMMIVSIVLPEIFVFIKQNFQLEKSI